MVTTVLQKVRHVKIFFVLPNDGGHVFYGKQDDDKTFCVNQNGERLYTKKEDGSVLQR